MSLALSPFVRRLLAVMILIGVVAAAWALVARPVMISFADYRRSIAQSQELLVRYRKIAAMRERLEEEIEKMRAASAVSERFLQGTSEELVAPGVQSKVRGLIDEHGATLKSIQILPRDNQERFRKVGVRVAMMADMEAFQKILYAFETGEPYLFLNNVTIRGRPNLRRRVNSNGYRAVEVRYDVFGYMQGIES